MRAQFDVGESARRTRSEPEPPEPESLRFRGVTGAVKERGKEGKRRKKRRKGGLSEVTGCDSWVRSLEIANAGGIHTHPLPSAALPPVTLPLPCVMADGGACRGGAFVDHGGGAQNPDSWHVCVSAWSVRRNRDAMYPVMRASLLRGYPVYTPYTCTSGMSLHIDVIIITIIIDAIGGERGSAAVWSFQTEGWFLFKSKSQYVLFIYFWKSKKKGEAQDIENLWLPVFCSLYGSPGQRGHAGGGVGFLT
jgi:hypothetical protein